LDHTYADPRKQAVLPGNPLHSDLEVHGENYSSSSLPPKYANGSHPSSFPKKSVFRCIHDKCEHSQPIYVIWVGVVTGVKA
jgi:hypothetical protein